MSLLLLDSLQTHNDAISCKCRICLVRALSSRGRAASPGFRSSEQELHQVHSRLMPHPQAASGLVQPHSPAEVVEALQNLWLRLWVRRD
jgi:hypothetical protein